MKLSNDLEFKDPRIDLAIKLLWASYAIGVLVSLLDDEFVRSVKADGGGIILIVWIVVNVLTFYWILSVSRGKNWARILMLPITLLAIPDFYMEYLIFEANMDGTSTFFHQSIANKLYEVTQIAVWFYATYVFFTGTSSQWFRKKAN